MMFFTLGGLYRAALDELNSFGEQQKVQLAVLVDHDYETSIKADYVGKNIPTNDGEHVQVMLNEVDGIDNVLLVKVEENNAKTKTFIGFRRLSSYGYSNNH